jgi:hypothetical protein
MSIARRGFAELGQSDRDAGGPAGRWWSLSSIASLRTLSQALAKHHCVSQLPDPSCGMAGMRHAINELWFSQANAGIHHGY